MRRIAPGLSVVAYLLTSVGAAAQQPAAQSRATIPRQLNLFDAEQLLRQRSLAIASGRSQLTAIEAARRIASFKPNPQLQLGMEQVPFRSPAPDSVPRLFSTNGNAGSNPVYTAQLSKLFERGGKRAFRERQADAQVGAASAQLEDVVRNQLFALRQAFGNAILARDNLRIAAEVDAQYAKTEQLTDERVTAGDLPGIELYRLQAGRLQFQQAVIDAQTAYEQAARDLLNVLSARTEDVTASTLRSPGSQPATDEDLFQAAPLLVAGEFSDAPIAQNLAQLKDLAHGGRPDLKVARANLEAANFGLKLALAQRSRDVSVATEYQRVGDDDTLGIVTQIPLLLYNNGKAGVEQAQALRAASEAQFQQTEIQVDTDVEKAHQNYLAAQRSLALYSSENLRQVEKVHDIIEFSYRNGAATLLELLEAERTVRQASSAFNQARANYQMSVWQLEQAVGSDLQ